MAGNFTRRDFLKLGAAAFGGALARPLSGQITWPSGLYPIGWGRVTVASIYVYDLPSFDAQKIAALTRDQLVAIFDEVTDPGGPEHNRRWYRTLSGYVYSARVQRVDPLPENNIVRRFRQNGLLAEVTVPFTDTFRATRTLGWVPLYRLYYGSVHWIVGLIDGPDGREWYRILDHLINVEYCAPAAHLRVLPYSEYSPISTEVPPEDKRIEISISAQTLVAYEAEKEVLNTRISSGLPSDPSVLGPDDIPTDTPFGSFNIQNKFPSRHMGNAQLTDDINAYELPGVPWTCLFHETGVGLHGTYWHDNFGIKMSHGCINMRTSDALWIFRWSNPVFTGERYYQQERGTRVVVKA